MLMGKFSLLSIATYFKIIQPSGHTESKSTRTLIFEPSKPVDLKLTGAVLVGNTYSITILSSASHVTISFNQSECNVSPQE